MVEAMRLAHHLERNLKTKYPHSNLQSKRNFIVERVSDADHRELFKVRTIREPSQFLLCPLLVIELKTTFPVFDAGFVAYLLGNLGIKPRED